MPADPELLFDGPDAPTTVALAHGAGAGMDSPFMDFFAKGLGKRGFRVVRFEYPYMAAKRFTGKSMPPDREPVLRETWLKVVIMLGRDGLVIGGKSMGGRIARLAADEAGVAALACLGYPFHPVGKPDQFRVTSTDPTLVLVFLEGKAGNRKLLLFGCSCRRHTCGGFTGSRRSGGAAVGKCATREPALDGGAGRAV